MAITNTTKNTMSVITNVGEIEKLINDSLYGVDRDAEVHLMSTRTFEGMRGRKTEYIFTIEGSEDRIKVDCKEGSEEMSARVIDPKAQKKMRNAYAKLCGEVSEKTRIPFEVVMAIGPDYAVEFVSKVQSKIPVEVLFYEKVSRDELCFILNLGGVLKTRIFEMGELNYSRVCDFLTKDRFFTELRKLMKGADVDAALHAKKIMEDMVYDKEHNGVPYFCRNDFQVRIVSRAQINMERNPEKAYDIYFDGNTSEFLEFLMEIPKSVIKNTHTRAFVDHCVFVTDRYYYISLKDAEKLQALLMMQNNL